MSRGRHRKLIRRLRALYGPRGYTVRVLRALCLWWCVVGVGDLATAQIYVGSPRANVLRAALVDAAVLAESAALVAERDDAEVHISSVDRR